MSLKQVLNSVWNKSYRNGTCKFQEIVGRDDIKLILNKALLSVRPIHILLVGEPGCAKTLFLTEIMRRVKTSLFVVGSNTTKAGLVNQLFERRPKFVLIDELEKMNKTDQMSLLHLMETGIISEIKINKTRQIELASWVFATANSYEKIIQPLLSRFTILEMPEYNLEEFTEIALIRLAKVNVDKCITRVIAERVWNELGSRDIRDVIKVARLTDTIQDVPFVIKMLSRQNKRIGANG